VPVSDQLIEKLVCPNCGRDLSYRAEDARIDCQACKLSYIVTDDIPVLLVDEAERLQSG
jgi:uncharacterized protein YbaR (Trm112 family)